MTARGACRIGGKLSDFFTQAIPGTALLPGKALKQNNFQNWHDFCGVHTALVDADGVHNGGVGNMFGSKRTGLAVAGALTATLAAVLATVPALAAPISTGTSTNLTAGGGAFFIGIGIGPNGISTVDGNVTGGGSDAYDQGNVLLVNGSTYAPATADLTGQTYTGNAFNFGGLSTTLQYHADASAPLLRSFAEFTNTTGSAINATITWQSNLGADGGTAIRASSSGDTSLGIDDSWLVTSDGGPFDPITSFRFYGLGSPLETTTNTFMTTTYSSAGDQGPRVEFDLSVGAGETVSLLWFSGLTGSNLGMSSGVAAASAMMAGLDGLATGDALLDGLTATQLSQTLNWNFGAAVPEPGMLPLALLGFATLAFARRRVAAAAR